MAERKGASYKIKGTRPGGDPLAHAQRTQASSLRIGSTVTLPQTGPFEITGMDRRYVTGVTPEGKRIGKTGKGLFTNEGIGGH